MNELLWLFYTLVDATMCISGLLWPHSLVCLAILLAVASGIAAYLAMQNQRNPYTLERIVAT